MDPLTVVRPRLATVWLGGCSGCHMSFLDMDERLLDLLAQVDLVYSPLMDVKEFPGHVDIALVEGAIANDDHLRQIQMIRERSDVLVAFGDCAVTGNVTALRNPLKSADVVLRHSYGHEDGRIPGLRRIADEHPVPPLLDKVRTIRGCVRVDVYLPGCPPPADVIFEVLSAIVSGRTAGIQNRARLG